MSAIFKPTPLSWEDIEGGVGETEIERIREFVGEYGYDTEKIPHSDDDESLANDIVFFSDQWERVDGYSWNTEIADAYQVTAILSLILGSFYDSFAEERIKQKLQNSATKPELVKMITYVAALYCEYISLKARIALAAGTEADT